MVTNIHNGYKVEAQADLSGANLSFLNTNDNTGGANEPNMTGANLTNANLYKVFLRRTEVLGAIFINANLTFATFIARITLDHCNFSGAILNGARFSMHCRFPLAKFIGASMIGTSFYYIGQEPGGTTTSVDFTKANLTDAVFEWTTIGYCTFKNTNLSGANFEKQCQISHSTFTDVDFNNASYNYSNFNNSKFINCSFVDARMNYNKANEYVSSGRTIAWPMFYNSTMTNCDFTGAKIGEADFTDVDFSGCTFTNVELRDVNLTDAKLANSTLKNVVSSGIVGTPKSLPTDVVIEDGMFVFKTNVGSISGDLNGIGYSGDIIEGKIKIKDYSGQLTVTLKESVVLTLGDFNFTMDTSQENITNVNWKFITKKYVNGLENVVLKITDGNGVEIDQTIMITVKYRPLTISLTENADEWKNYSTELKEPVNIDLTDKSAKAEDLINLKLRIKGTIDARTIETITGTSAQIFEIFKDNTIRTATTNDISLKIINDSASVADLNKLDGLTMLKIDVSDLKTIKNSSITEIIKLYRSTTKFLSFGFLGLVIKDIITNETGSIEASNIKTLDSLSNYQTLDVSDVSKITGTAADIITTTKSTVKKILFKENFDNLLLGPFVSDSESGGDGTDWTATAPNGWSVVKHVDDGHGLVGSGNSVQEFDGWTFFDPKSWSVTSGGTWLETTLAYRMPSAGDNREQFVKGVGVIAVADSDEFDDKDSSKMNSSLLTPEIDISAASANSLVLQFDSSWRQGTQFGKVMVRYDDGEQVTLLEYKPDTPTAYNDTINLNLNNPKGAKKAVITWHYKGHNSWWWAIDNIEVYYRTVAALGNYKVIYNRNIPLTVNSGEATLSQARILDGLTTGVVTATIADTKVQDLLGNTPLLNENKNNAFSIRIVELDSKLSVAELTELINLTSVRIDATKVTTITGTYQQLITFYAGDKFTGLGNENISLVENLTVEQINAINRLTTGTVETINEKTFNDFLNNSYLLDYNNDTKLFILLDSNGSAMTIEENTLFIKQLFYNNKGVVFSEDAWKEVKTFILERNNPS